FLFQPLFQENYHKHGGHDKVKSLCVEMYQRSEDTSQRRAEEPVKMVQQRHKKHEPASVHVVRYISGIVDGKTFVAHAKNQVYFLPSDSPEFFQHGYAVKQVAGIDHEGHGQRLQRIK